MDIFDITGHSCFEEKFERLPKWAQRRMRNLALAVKQGKETKERILQQIDPAKPDTDIFISRCYPDPDIPLPRATKIKFYKPGCESDGIGSFEVGMEGGKLKIWARGGLTVKPEISNVVIVDTDR